MERPTNANVMKARELRRLMSPPERVLWSILKLRPEGLKFRRQHSIGPFYADFYCAALKLVIEVDGESHDSEESVVRDERRDRWMRNHGLRVIRFTASEVMKDLESVVTAITGQARR